MNDIHVYPINDLKNHNIDCKDCSCNPKIKRSEDDSFWIVIHKSFDMREYIEEEQSVN